jgi:hypothetical protein
MRQLRRKRLLKAFRNQLGREGEPAPDRILRRSFKSFFLVFLTGKAQLGEAESGLRDLVLAMPLVPGLPSDTAQRVDQPGGAHRVSLSGPLSGTPLEAALSFSFLAERLSLTGLKRTAATAQLAELKLARQSALLAVNTVTAGFGPGLVKWLKREGVQGDFLLAFGVLSIAKPRRWSPPGRSRSVRRSCPRAGATVVS